MLRFFTGRLTALGRLEHANWPTPSGPISATKRSVTPDLRACQPTSGLRRRPQSALALDTFSVPEFPCSVEIDHGGGLLLRVVELQHLDALVHPVQKELGRLPADPRLVTQLHVVRTGRGEAKRLRVRR